MNSQNFEITDREWLEHHIKNAEDNEIEGFLNKTCKLMADDFELNVARSMALESILAKRAEKLKK